MFKISKIWAALLLANAFAANALASVQIFSFESGGKNQSIPNIRIENLGGSVSGFQILYYFPAADSRGVSADAYYLAGGNLTVEKLSANQYVAVLNFDSMRVDSSSAIEFPFDETYGVFAAESSATLRHSKIKVDDEDSGNANSWKWYNAPEEIQARIQKIASGGSNTIYHVVRWVKLTLALFSGAK